MLQRLKNETSLPLVVSCGDIRTMKSFIESGELKVGREFTFANGETLLIGHATLQHRQLMMVELVGITHSGMRELLLEF